MLYADFESILKPVDESDIETEMNRMEAEKEVVRGTLLIQRSSTLTFPSGWCVL